MAFYQNSIRPILFKINPESIHNFVIFWLRFISNIEPCYRILSQKTGYDDPILKQNLWNIDFVNPVGLASGFDKNCLAPKAGPMLGFGWSEIGSVTSKAQPGNPRPRLFRIPEKKSIIVYYGLANDGVDNVSQRMSNFLKNNNNYPLGSSIAKTNCIKDGQTIEDYLDTFKKIYPFSKFLTVNISCPNVPAFQADKIDIGFVRELLRAVQQARLKQADYKPLMIKIGPDYDKDKLEQIIDIAVENKIEAVIATNLTKKRENLNLDFKYQKMPGGVSGKLLQTKSDQVISYIYKYAGDKIKIIGCGGVFTAEDAYRKIRLGSHLLQLITGMIYNGPMAIKHINQGLAELLHKDGFEHISKAIGIDSQSV